MRFYIAGPMSGQPEYNYPLFAKAAKELRDLDHEVIAPPEIAPLREGASYNDYFLADLHEMVKYEAIVLLPAWSTSKGTLQELDLAIFLGKKVYMYCHHSDCGHIIHPA